MVFIGKAIADIVSNKANWIKSVFSVYEIDSFFGSKEYTWVRKHNYDQPLLHFLFKTIFVTFTDIWHFANTLRRIGIYGSLFCAHYFSITEMIYILPIYIFVNMMGFHLAYHKWLRI